MVEVTMNADLARAFIAFLAIVDPVGNVLVFYLITRSLSRAYQLRVAALAVASAGAMLVLFSLAGREVLGLLGISGESFRVAAGGLLLLPAYRLVASGQPMEVDESEVKDPEQLALVPLATPLMAGPGALATAISFGETLGRATTILALGGVLALSFASFVAAGWLFTWLRPALLQLLSRLVGIVLFAIAVEFILDGLRAYFR